MSGFNVGDKVEIVYHANSEYNGKSGKLMFIGNSLKSGTNMLEGKNLGTPHNDTRLIVTLDNGIVINDLREVQVRKIFEI